MKRFSTMGDVAVEGTPGKDGRWPITDLNRLRRFLCLGDETGCYKVRHEWFDLPNIIVQFSFVHCHYIPRRKSGDIFVLPPLRRRRRNIPVYPCVRSTGKTDKDFFLKLATHVKLG